VPITSGDYPRTFGTGTASRKTPERVRLRDFRLCSGMSRASVACPVSWWHSLVGFKLSCGAYLQQIWTIQQLGGGDQSFVCLIWMIGHRETNRTCCSRARCKLNVTQGCHCMFEATYEYWKLQVNHQHFTNMQIETYLNLLLEGACRSITRKDNIQHLITFRIRRDQHRTS
jgi:hypothetical protein